MTPEFSRPVRLDTLGGAPKAMAIEAGEDERAALAERFDLTAIESLSAALTLVRDEETVSAKGTLHAVVTQPCVASGAPVPALVDAPFVILFRPQPVGAGDEEIELGESEMDVVFYDGAMIDVGEAVAETLSLSLDPWPRAPDAEAALAAAGVSSEAEARAANSPFAVLRPK